MDILSSKASLHGEMTVVGSKSHTIRAIALATLSQGKSIIRNPLKSNDAYSALEAAKLLGAKAELFDDRWEITGCGRQLNVPCDVINTGNSGTATFFFMPISALAKGICIVTGDDQIRRRPVIELVNNMNALGADVRISRPGCDCPPVVIEGPMHGGTAHFCGKNSQYVSGIMIAAPLMDGDTVIYIDNPYEKPYLQLTFDWMERFGIKAENVYGDYKEIRIKGGMNYTPCDAVVPADWSGALFPITAAVLTDSELTINGVDFNDSQGDKAIVDYLISMGASIEKNVERKRLIVHGAKPLIALEEINLEDTPDSLPILSLAAALAKGTTKFTGLAHVRVKESDRVAVMEELLSKMGVPVTSDATSMTVTGVKKLRGIEANSHGDHRIAMTMAVAGMVADGGVKVLGAECASVSFPGFYELFNNNGSNFQQI